MPGIRPLYHITELCLGERVWNKVGKRAFIALLGKERPQWANVLKTVCKDLEGIVRSFYRNGSKRRCDQLMRILLMVG